MPSLRSINKREETSKPDTGKYGLRPFMGAPGYAGVVCCPTYTVIGIVWGIVHQIKKQKHKKEDERAATEANSTVGYSDGGDDVRPRKKQRRERDRTKQRNRGDISPPRVTHGFKGDPKNTRVCSTECPGYGKDYCVAHHESEPDRPASPGMLAV
ncbi:hypothetical protein CKAH01_14995 [Colletotrichum kahawae]|uniref:Uncharacterized protein n=1 Tax=Colletotrichum kahawae TaxID=34407 RepID=A0AAD9YLZ6_COLKA|nr:hypothetical protein CKAH01_14995 [Colletotrichum kahawae]